MSIRIMTLVWDKFPAAGSELLAMLALADWAGDDGGSLYPSMAAVATKIRLSEKQARRIVQGFVQDGYLTVVGNANGGAPGSTKQFRFNVAKLASLPDLPTKTSVCAAKTPPSGVTPPAGVTPPMGGREGSHRCPETAPTHGSLTVIEPSVEPSIEEARAQAPGATLPKLDEAFDAEQAEVKAQAKAAKPAKAAAVQRPDGVAEQVWTDWLALRKAKRAPVSLTVLDGAQEEAGKAGMTLDAFLREWVNRGSQGLKAEWLQVGAVAAKTAIRRTPANEDFASKDYGVRRKL